MLFMIKLFIICLLILNFNSANANFVETLGKKYGKTSGCQSTDVKKSNNTSLKKDNSFSKKKIKY